MTGISNRDVRKSYPAGPTVLHDVSLAIQPGEFVVIVGPSGCLSRRRHRHYSRRVIGWALQSRQTTDVVLQALLMAFWRRKPNDKVLIHSDQGSQFTSMDWALFLKHHILVR